MQTYILTCHISQKSNRGMRLRQPMCIVLKQMPRGVISTVTLPPQWRSMKRIPDLIRGHQISGKAQNNTQKVTAALTPPMVNMMSNDDRCLCVGRWVILVTTAPVCTVITVMPVATSPRIAQRKSPHWKHHSTTTGCTSNHITTTIGTDLSSLQMHSRNMLWWVRITPISFWLKLQQLSEAHILLSINHHSSSWYHPPKDALGNALARTHHTGTTVTHLWHATLPTRVTLMIILQIKASLVQDTSHNTPYRPYTQKASKPHSWKATPHGPQHHKSPFRTHNWTLPQNQTTLIV